MISEPKVGLAITMHLSCIQTDQNEIPHDPRHIGFPSDVSKMIFEPMVHSTQTMHLSCVKVSTMSKQTKMSFQLSLWYIWRKSCTYLVQTLTPSPNRSKWDSIGPMSPRSPIGCVQIDFRAYGTFTANRAPILRQDLHYLQMDQNKFPVETRNLGVPLGVLSLWYVWRKPYTYLVPTLTTSPNGPNEIPHDPCHLGVQPGASKTISKPMVHSTQTMHLFCVNISTISKQTKMSI
jgi:hypothetical protein